MLLLLKSIFMSLVRRKHRVYILLFLLLTPFVSYSQYGLDEAAGAAGLSRRSDIKILIGDILSTVIAFIGVIFLILTIYGGFLWMTSGGDSEKAKKGAGFIKSGVIGVIIIMSAYAITKFVFSELIK